MSFLDRLERLLGRVAIPHLALYLVAGQAGVLLLTLVNRLDPSLLVFVPALAAAGQWWRAVAFLLLPTPFPGSLLGYVFTVFGWWLFYFMGTALEHYWGVFRFNLYLLIGYALTVGLAFVTPEAPVPNLFLAGSVFLAFALLNPNFELAIFFFFPIRIKWLAALTWLGYGWTVATGGAAARLQVLAATGSFFLFFGRTIWSAAGARTRQIRAEAPPARAAGQPRHRCRVCGRTDLSNPELDFRYCSKCAGEECYCPEHIFNHEHVRGGEQAP